jgi:glycosyltransferase 2 family protein
VNRQRLLRGIVVAALLSALVYAVLAATADVQSVASAIRHFPLWAFVLMLALTLTCYSLRAVRWQYLTKALGYPESWRDAFYVQFSGMTMTLTPGKVGEVLKAFLAREITEMPMARGISLVFSERLTDLIAVIALSAGGLSLLGEKWSALAIVAVTVAAGTATLSSRRFHEFALRVVTSRSWAKRHHASATEVSETIRITLSPRRLAVSIALAAIAWGAEGVAFWVCINALGFHGLSVAPSVAIYAVSTVVGALLFLPGGIGLTEVSLTGLLVAARAPREVATAATVLIRVVTLWFGVGLGWLVFASRPKLLRAFFGTSADAEDAAESASPR